MKKIMSVVAILLLVAMILCSGGCKTATTSEAVEETEVTAIDLGLLEENLSDDNYGNYYEIFVYSFYDSDGDGIGDLNGVTEKLDYIKDMGYTGIWLMPICQAYSYHKYDVTDYYSVDSDYGTMDDFENLIAEAHARGIKVILDLVVNHSSSEHPWFKSAIESAWAGDTEGEYYDYYNFSDTALSGYSYYDGIYYESQFVYSMPDFNLDSENVRAEITNIIAFWLDKGADGFRLDACTSYYTGYDDLNAEFCNWITQQVLAINPDAFVVGEVWSSESTIKKYYEAAVDTAFFSFPTSQQEGYIVKTFTNSSPAAYYWKFANTIVKTANSYESIAAPFLCNHDTGRIAGSCGRIEERVKFAYGMLSMLNGTTFTYYGDEIGMVGSGDDPNKRIAMLWDNDKTNITENPPGTKTAQYCFDGVAELLEDASSILYYYKLCNNVRNAFPAIARGVMERIDYDDEYVLIFTKTYNDETVTIMINFATEEHVVTLDASWEIGTLQKALVVGEETVTLEDDVLTMPMYSIAIFSKG